MSEQLIVAIINFATKFGIDAAIAIIEGIKNPKTIDDAIKALRAAQMKTAQQYVNEA